MNARDLPENADCSGAVPRTDGVRATSICGADVELGNFFVGDDDVERRPLDAARLVLRSVPGVRPRRQVRVASWASGSWSTLREDEVAEHTRVWLPTNGGCVYIDMSHVEVCLPEVSSAFDHLAAWHAMLRIVRDAAERASQDLPEGLAIELTANNSDGSSHSWGGHLDFMVSRFCWDAVSRKVGALVFLASHHASSIVYTGAGKVGSENYRPRVDFQISQRADFVESLIGLQTTYSRPLVNIRDEALCGSRDFAYGPDAQARMHVIHCDSGLCHGSQVLKVGVEQIVLAMLGAGRIPRSLLLDDPVEAIVAWSHDVSLSRRADLAGGGSITAVDLQRRLFDAAQRSFAAGELELIPRVGEILALWDDTLAKLAARDFAALASRIDWLLKCELVAGVRRGADDDEEAGARAKHADLQYAALSRDRGLYWLYEDAGYVERYVTEAEIAHFEADPPRDTRARTRAWTLRLFRDEVWDVDWDLVRLRSHGGRDVTLDMDDPRDPGLTEPVAPDENDPNGDYTTADAGGDQDPPTAKENDHE